MRSNTFKQIVGASVAGVLMVLASGMSDSGQARADGGGYDADAYFQNDRWSYGVRSNDDVLLLVDSAPIIGEFSVDVQLAQAEDSVNDPLEPLNRAIFAFNDVVYDVLLGPLADAYNVLPVEYRTIIGSILSNLKAPVVFFNDLLQGEIERAFTTFARFTMNTTFGFGGMADVAASAGLEQHDEDFGQTMAVWGAGEGFYLVLPILGPSNPRDAVGKFIVDPWIDPFSMYLDNTDQEGWGYARMGATAVDEFASVRDELENIKRTSIDYYAAVRSLYRQRRAAEISNGEDLSLPAIPDFDLGEDDFLKEGVEPATLPATDGTDGQQISSLYVVTVGTSSDAEPVPASDVALWNDPLGARFEPANNEVSLSDGYYVLAPRKPASPFDDVESAL